MERSHIPLRKWALAFRLMAGKKKGMSRTSSAARSTSPISPRGSWRIASAKRCARTPSRGRTGGQNKVVEVTKPMSAARREPQETRPAKEGG